MSKSSEPLKIDPTELRLTAEKLDGHASGFRAAHEAAHSQAGKAALGSGLAAAALPAMLSAWESDGARFDKHFATYTERHREAAGRYERTDTDNAGGIDDVSSAL